MINILRREGQLECVKYISEVISVLLGEYTIFFLSNKYLFNSDCSWVFLTETTFRDYNSRETLKTRRFYFDGVQK